MRKITLFSAAGRSEAVRKLAIEPHVFVGVAYMDVTYVNRSYTF